MQYFNKCMESASSVCLDRRTTIESAEGLQQAQVCIVSSARIDRSLFYNGLIKIFLYFISLDVVYGRFFGCSFGKKKVLNQHRVLLMSN